MSGYAAAQRDGNVDELLIHGEVRASELSERLRFETLLADLSVRFVNVPAEDVDREIIDAQRQLCACLGVDVSSVWQPAADESGMMCLTHFCRPASLPPAPQRVTAENFPWVASQVLAGKTVPISSTANTPPEAARDRELWTRYGIKSTLALPLSAGGGPVFGVLVFATISAEIDWPAAIVNRCRVIAQVFANALARKGMERALRESEERFRTITQNLPGVVYQFYARDDGQWGMHYVDPRAEEVCGLPPEPLSTFLDRFAACVAPEDRERWTTSIQEAVHTVSAWEQAVRFIKPGGEEVYLRGFSRPRRVGSEVLFNGVLRDITEHKRTEIAVAESEKRYRVLFESAPVGIVWIGVDGFVKAANSVQARMYGYESADELIGYYTPNFVAEKDSQRASQNMRTQLNGADVPPRVYALVRRDGSEFVGEVTAGLLRGPQGEVQGYLCATRDITALVTAQEHLNRTLEELNRLKEQLQHENVYLRKEVQTLQGQTPIVGNSEPLRRMLAQAEQVAVTDSTVLILGETGTGKELLASYLHRIGKRADRPFITTNVAAIPSTLLESELFGREKGAYTGALTKQIGRFEMADRGTLFLDEIGEMPLEMQAKLLRVLQEGKFERLGSGKTLHADVRIIAATNRDLEKAVAEGTFRGDLYYRLNVFPIIVPPLRERRQDIPQLVWGFVKEFSERMGKPVTSIPKSTIEALQRHSWPGNVRELRNVIERAMILSRGEILQIALPEISAAAAAEGDLTLDDLQRRHIMQILEQTNFRIRGAGGAAALLGVKPTTLESRMAKLGIARTPASE